MQDIRLISNESKSNKTDVYISIRFNYFGQNGKIRGIAGDTADVVEST